MAAPRREEVRTVVARLFDSYGASLYRYAVMLLADPTAAEDAVQQVFAKIIRKGASLTLEDELHYLRRAVRNECYSMLRQQLPNRTSEPPLLLEPTVPIRVSPEDVLALHQALRTLSAEQREVVHLHIFEGLAFREIGEVLGESINTIASRYRYAIANLRDVFNQQSSPVNIDR